MAYKTSFTFGALVLSTALTLPAQNNRVHADDADGNGTLSRAEWRGTRDEFRQLDINRDGMLSGNEIPGYRTRSRSADNRTTYNNRNESAGRLDQNASGVVEGYEWPYQADVFHELDTDGNSVLSPDELSKLTNVGLSRLDKNRDGRLDTNEWPGGYAQFDRLDQNRDDKINSNEYFQRGGEFQKRNRFDDWDTNRNGIIESTEWKSAPRLFHRLDTDGDSRVSWDEFMADKERYNPPYSWR